MEYDNPDKEAQQRLMSLLRKPLPQTNDAKVAGRIRHDLELNLIHPGRFTPAMSDDELLAIYRTGEHDAVYGIAMASKHGLRLPPVNAHEYDPSIYNPNVKSGVNRWGAGRVGDRDTDFFMHLRRLGAVYTFSGKGEGGDGITYINVYSDGRTFVGREASNFAEGNYHTPDGIFRTLEGYYHWLRIRDWMTVTGQDPTQLEARYAPAGYLRKCTGQEAIRRGRALKAELYGGSSYKVGEFSADSTRAFKLALADKLHRSRYGNPTRGNAFASDTGGRTNSVTLGNYLSELVYNGFTLDHHYVYHGEIRRVKFGEWLPNLLNMLLVHIDPNSDDFDLAALQAKIRKGEV